MSVISSPQSKPWSVPAKLMPGWGWQVGIGASIYAVVSVMILRAHPDAMVRFRISFEPIISAPLMVQVHVAAAFATFAIGVFLLSARKGFRLHKTVGWMWVVAMATTAGSSFFLTGLMGSAYSPIHALSAWVMLGLPFGIAAIRRKDLALHRRRMTGMFVGGMVIAGLFSFLPGRLMWNMFFTA